MAAAQTGLRLKEEARRRLHALAEESGQSLADVATAGIDALWASREAAMAERRERVRRTCALLEELRRRLGDDLFEGAGQVGFSDSGPIAVEANGIAYVLAGDGTITASRATGGRSEMAIVDESGISGWMATAPPIIIPKKTGGGGPPPPHPNDQRKEHHPMPQSEATILPSEDVTPTPGGPPAGLVALFPNVPLERWEYIPPRPGASGQWKVATGPADAVPLAETLKRSRLPERMTLKQAIKMSVEQAKRAREGTGPVYAGRPHPRLAERYERQGRELRALSALSRRRGVTTVTAPPRRTPPARPAARRPSARRSLGARSSQDPGEQGDSERPPPRRGELRPLSHALSAVLEDIAPRDLHLIDCWWGSTSRLIDILEWSAFPLERLAEGVLTHCPACVRGPLFVTEPRADHAELTCGHGCPEAAIRVKLKDIEALASESIDEEVVR